MSIEKPPKKTLREQIEADRAVEEAIHFEGIDLDDLIDVDLAAYEKYVLPMKQFNGLSSKEKYQKILESPALSDELVELITDFRRAEEILIKETSKIKDKKVIKSRREFWNFISNKMGPAMAAEYLKKRNK